ncbi:MAG: DoxX family protein [Hyphomicrobiales bacterium]|nr:DoxX family protein [Hyphomicrobiales bacterium]
MSEVPSREPSPLIPVLAPFYDTMRDLSWPLLRFVVGGALLIHGIAKLLGPGVAAFAAGSLSRRGIEPAVPLAYVIFFLETIGAVCIVLGLFTRFFAAAVAIEMAVITFFVFYPNGYGFSSPGGGWEFPFIWGALFFIIALRGGGPWSLDRLVGKEL